MEIRKKGYNSWDGNFIFSKKSFLTIFSKGAKDILSKKRTKFLFFFPIIHFLFFAAAIYVTSKPELKAFTDMVELLKSDASIFKIFYTNNFMIFILLVISIFTGAELISKDIKFNAIPLYFSRPVTKYDYLLGKISIVCFYFLVFTLLPGLLLILLKIIFTNSMSFNILIMIFSILFPIIFAIFFSLIALLFSSFTENDRFVKISIFLLYFFSDIIYNIFKNVFNNKFFSLISIRENIINFGKLCFQDKYSFNLLNFLSGLIIIFFSVFALLIILKKLSKFEKK